jgi:hypothetical protein
MLIPIKKGVVGLFLPTLELLVVDELVKRGGKIRRCVQASACEGGGNCGLEAALGQRWGWDSNITVLCLLIFWKTSLVLFFTAYTKVPNCNALGNALLQWAVSWNSSLE